MFGELPLPSPFAFSVPFCLRKHPDWHLTSALFLSCSLHWPEVAIWTDRGFVSPARVVPFFFWFFKETPHPPPYWDCATLTLAHTRHAWVRGVGNWFSHKHVACRACPKGNPAWDRCVHLGRRSLPSMGSLSQEDVRMALVSSRCRARRASVGTVGEEEQSWSTETEACLHCRARGCFTSDASSWALHEVSSVCCHKRWSMNVISRLFSSLFDFGSCQTRVETIYGSQHFCSFF